MIDAVKKERSDKSQKETDQSRKGVVEPKSENDGVQKKQTRRRVAGFTGLLGTIVALFFALLGGLIFRMGLP